LYQQTAKTGDCIKHTNVDSVIKVNY